MMTKLPLLLTSAGLLALTACTDPNQYGGGTDPNAKTKSGALIGAGLGAAVGILRGDDPEERRRGAVIGAAVGSGAGALIGRQLDQQEAALRQSMNNDQVLIENTGESLIVTLPQDILFDVDSAVVRSGLQSDLRALAANLQNYPNSAVRVTGHTDSTGEAAYNEALSLRRADSVAKVLIGSGVSSSRIITAGRGEAQPVTTNLTPEGRAKNRRVEIVIIPTV
ncbi:OmpA family protein [Poseidonocella sedimentorum]|uniref:Outer membrane protein OmpA n=1 Tax=Poseidonocella sedimentorum TaxID=871652 RepID=A0A1I6D726_9RHOB|nr:OmpA family protein [Poseidonocella sedimentorum]SFR01274.1 Outer membrane protein OmpA [Poseidonocella sedimentorum]